MNEPFGLPALPTRPEGGHKGTFGRVLIVAGSRGMSGAACLAGLGALRGGAGLVRVAVPETIADIVAAVEPSYLVTPLPADAGRLGVGARSLLHDLAESADVVAIGPGIGRSGDLDDLVSWAYTSIGKPMLFDADALNSIANMPELLEASRTGGPRVLTPHPGEFARLTGTEMPATSTDRAECAQRFAERAGVILVLKGAGTVVTSGRQTAINTTGNSGLGTGGTGDVLTGLIAALLAQGMTPFDAARLGVHVHGLAGDLAAADLSQPGLIASDLPHYVARAWRALATEQ